VQHIYCSALRPASVPFLQTKEQQYYKYRACIEFGSGREDQDLESRLRLLHQMAFSRLDGRVFR
jgi:hypothetical protein